MKIFEYTTPRSHFVIDGFLPTDDLARVWSQVTRLGPFMNIGLQGGAENRYHKRKQNRVAIVDETLRIGGRPNQILPRVRTCLRSPALLDALRIAQSPTFHILEHCGVNSLQASSYGDGEFYDPHEDVNLPSNITFVLLLCREPQRFRGGSLVLEHAGVRRSVRFKNNRALIFPSNTKHWVTRVRQSSREFVDGRFSLQAWPALDLQTVQPQTPASRRARDLAHRKRVGTPYFAIDDSVWSDAQKCFGFMHPTRTWSGRLQQVLVALRLVAAALESNVRYLARRLLDRVKHRFLTQVVSRREPHGDALRVRCDVRDGPTAYSFGYVARDGANGFELRLYASVSGRERTTCERQIAISRNADVGVTVAVLRKLMGAVVRARRCTPGAAATRSPFSESRP